MRRRPLVSILLLGPLLLLLAVMMMVGAVVLIALVLTVLLSFGLLWLAMASVRRRVSRRRRYRRSVSRQHRRTASSEGIPAEPGQPVGLVAPQAPAVPDWAATKARFVRLRSEYGQFECDPLAVLQRPALADVTVPSTARFVDAFAEAQALDTDAAPPPEHAARFATAVDAAWRTWQAARDAADRIRLSGIPAEERATVQRAIKLLTMARDSAFDAERATAYARARAELAKLERSGTVRLPPAASAALDAAARGQLPHAPVTTALP